MKKNLIYLLLSILLLSADLKAQVGSGCSSALNIGQGDTCVNNLNTTYINYYVKFTASDTAFRIILTNHSASNNDYIEKIIVYTGTCNNLTATDSAQVLQNDSVINLILSSLTINNTYYICLINPPSINQSGQGAIVDLCLTSNIGCAGLCMSVYNITRGDTFGCCSDHQPYSISDDTCEYQGCVGEHFQIIPNAYYPQQNNAIIQVVYSSDPNGNPLPLPSGPQSVGTIFNVVLNQGWGCYWVWLKVNDYDLADSLCNDIYYYIKISARQAFWNIPNPTVGPICPGQPAVLFALPIVNMCNYINLTYFTPSPDLMYVKWLPQNACYISQFSPNTNAYPASTTQYTILFRDSIYSGSLTNGGYSVCYDTAHVTVLVHEPDFNYDTVCLGNATSFNLLINCPYDSIRWNFGEPSSGPLNTSILTNPGHTYANAGNYTVQLIVYYAPNPNCPNVVMADTITHVIAVYPQVPIPVITGPQSTCAGSNAIFTVFNCNAPPSYVYAWSTNNNIGIISGQGSCQIVADLTAAQATGGCISVIVTDTVTGCQNSFRICLDKCCTQPNASCVNNNPNFYAYPAFNATQINTQCPGFGSGNPYQIVNQQFSINGTFVVNTNLTFTNCRVIMGPNAKIIISPGIIFKLERSHLYGCDPMWDGINIGGPTAKFISNLPPAQGSYTLIEDADTAVISVNGGVYTLSNVIFNKNYKGIVVLGDNNTQHSGTIHTSVFTCRNNIPTPYNSTMPIHVVRTQILNTSIYPTATMQAPHIGERTHTGIELAAVRNLTTPGSFITIGSNLAQPMFNLFDYVGCGIHGILSNAKIINNFFKNIVVQQGQFTKAGIWAESGNIFIPINSSFVVGDNGANNRNRFENCLSGIIMEKNMNLTARRNTFINTAGNCINVQTAQNNNTVLIEYNTMLKFTVGVRAFQNFKCNFTVSNDTMQGTGGFAPTGVLVNELSNTNTNAVYTIKGNQIHQVRFGINILNAYKPGITQNGIRLNPNLTNATGIRMLGCQSAFVSTNHVRALPATSVTGIGGIFASLSPGSVITCNLVEQMGYGIKCAGPMPSKIFNNDMKNLTRGFWLDNFGFVGPQGDPSSPTNATQNKWTVVSSTTRLFSSNGTIGSLSPFYYLSSGGPNQNSGTPSSSFATPITTFPTASFSFLLCVTPPPALIVNPNAIALNLINFPGNDIVGKYLNRKALYQNIKLDSINVSSDTLLTSFMNTESNSTIGSLTAINDVITDNDSNSVNTVLNTAINNCNNLNCSNAAIHNQKLVAQIMLAQIQNQQLYLDSADVNTLRTIANLCPYTDGIGVYQARAILSIYDPYGTEYISSCEMEQENERVMNTYEENPVNTFSDFNLYPNPSDGNIILEYNIEQNAEMIITDITGKEICRYLLSKEKNLANISCDELENGIYVYKILARGHILKSDKLVIIK